MNNLIRFTVTASLALPGILTAAENSAIHSCAAIENT